MWKNQGTKAPSCNRRSAPDHVCLKSCLKICYFQNAKIYLDSYYLIYFYLFIRMENKYTKRITSIYASVK